MSFVVAFAPFLRLAVSDDAARPVDAFSFVPTARTRKVMADHEIVFRGEPSGFALYYKSNPAVAPALLTPILARTRFSFAMMSSEADFFDRHFPDFAGGAAQILLDNLDGGGGVATAGPLSVGATVEAADLVPIGPAAYPVRLDVSGGAPAVVEARDRFAGTVVASTDIVAEPGALELVTAVDLSRAADAAVRLVAPAPASLDRLIYADDEIADAGAVGAVDLYWEQPQDAVPAGTGAVYAAVFRRRP